MHLFQSGRKNQYYYQHLSEVAILGKSLDNSIFCHNRAKSVRDNGKLLRVRQVVALKLTPEAL
jgi:hypothetical protein